MRKQQRIAFAFGMQISAAIFCIGKSFTPGSNPAIGFLGVALIGYAFFSFFRYFRNNNEQES